MVALSSERATLVESRVGMVVAREVDGGPIRTGILLAGRVDGRVEAQMDTADAVKAGLVAGAAAGIVYFLTRLLLRR